MQPTWCLLCHFTYSFKRMESWLPPQSPLSATYAEVETRPIVPTSSTRSLVGCPSHLTMRPDLGTSPAWRRAVLRFWNPKGQSVLAALIASLAVGARWYQAAACGLFFFIFSSAFQNYCDLPILSTIREGRQARRLIFNSCCLSHFKELRWLRLAFDDLVHLQPHNICRSSQLHEHLVMTSHVPALS